MTRLLAILVAALLAGGVTTALLKDAEEAAPPSGLSVPSPVPSGEVPPPITLPTETMTFDGPAPFETPATPRATSTPTGGLPVTGGPGAWPPALAALTLAGVAATALRRARD